MAHLSLAGQVLKSSAPRQAGHAISRGSRLNVQARRTVAEKFKTKSEPNWMLDEPTRLWEIGGRFWFPFSTFEPPEYLDGTLPGDRGFDPFRLGALWGNPPNEGEDSRSRVGWLLEGELYNGRVAMLAVVGILTVELIGRGPWWQAVNTSNWGGPGFAIGVVLFHLAFALLEKNRIENYAESGEAGHFGFQAWVTGKGPLENAYDHYTNPFGANVFTYGEKGYYVTYFVLGFALIMHLAEVARRDTTSSPRTLARAGRTISGTTKGTVSGSA